jgi:NitT/TauT family transport system substrate-binding protein
MVAQDSPIKTAADLNGKVFAVNGLGNVIEYGSRQWIDVHGGNAKTIKFVEVPFPAMAAALAQHRVDAATLVEPFVSDAKGTARSLGSAFEAIGSHFMTVGWFASDDWLQKNPDVAARFIAAVRRAAVWGNSHRKESGDILIRYAKIKPETLAQMTRCSYGLELSVKDIQPVIDVGVKYGAVDHPITAQEIIWHK